MTAEKIPLWKQIGRESVWGMRCLVNVNSLWLFLLKKAPQGGPQILLPCLQILGTVCWWVLVSILANDLSDCPEDAAAGKQRWICDLPYATSWGIVIAISAVGLGIRLGFAQK